MKNYLLSLLALLCCSYLAAQSDPALAAHLDTVYQDDQVYRLQMKAIIANHGWESQEWKIMQGQMAEKDAVNQTKVTKILDARGWLGADVVGQQGNQAIFLVVQHGDLSMQEKYLPMMRAAVKSGAAAATNLALLEDRVALKKGKLQVYGSQLGADTDTGEYFVLPMEDPDHVDERRASVGLGTLQSYISNWGLTWDVEAYKLKLPGYIEKMKKN